MTLGGFGDRKLDGLSPKVEVTPTDRCSISFSTRGPTAEQLQGIARGVAAGTLHPYVSGWWERERTPQASALQFGLRSAEARWYVVQASGNQVPLAAQAAAQACQELVTLLGEVASAATLGRPACLHLRPPCLLALLAALVAVSCVLPAAWCPAQHPKSAAICAAEPLGRRLEALLGVAAQAALLPEKVESLQLSLQEQLAAHAEHMDHNFRYLWWQQRHPAHKQQPYVPRNTKFTIPSLPVSSSPHSSNYGNAPVELHADVELLKQRLPPAAEAQPAPPKAPRLTAGPATQAVLQQRLCCQRAAAAAAAPPAMQAQQPTSPLQVAPETLRSMVCVLLQLAGGYGLRASEVCRVLCRSCKDVPIPSMLLLHEQPAVERSKIHQQVRCMSAPAALEGGPAEPAEPAEELLGAGAGYSL